MTDLEFWNSHSCCSISHSEYAISHWWT